MSKIKYVDFHTHLHAYAEAQEFLEPLERLGILSLASSIDFASYEYTKELSKVSAKIIPSFGIHPAQSARFTDLQSLDEALAESSIIGEIGLDYFWCDLAPQKQERVFEYILDHCNHFSKYCVIHTKGAEARVKDILASFPKARPIIHWYSGPLEVFDAFVERAYPCTFSCELQYSRENQALLARTPRELLLAETDNPDSEIWLGGSSRSPELITRVYADIARLKHWDLEETRSLLTENSLAILRASGYAL